jgi:hypothetical protein
MSKLPALKLEHERKLCELVHCDPPVKRWEASGILRKDRQCFVVFDDRAEIACVAEDLQPSAANRLVGKANAHVGYEGITYNADKQRYYLLVEARKQSSGCYQALIVEYDEDFAYVKDRPVDFTFKSSNKGFEAVAHLRRDETDYLLALCEGNNCKCGAKGRKPGRGRIQVFSKSKKRWQHARTIALPSSLPFVDYSGMSIDGEKMAVVSQENSMLWVGRFDEAGWQWRDDGQLFEFPRSDDGDILYGNIEGVAWLSPTRVVTVSDRRKKSSQPDKRLSDKDQSIHIFEIP